MSPRATLSAIALFCALSPASASEAPIDLSGAVTLDIASVIAGDGDARLRVLSNIDVFADADLAALAGWQGARAHVHVLDNRGARPNDSAMTLQGVDNIEVPDAGLRLFEAWIEQDLGKDASLLVGLYDLNSEFYTNEAAGVLIAPPFGIGSELAATGPNGPSIFPYSALAARLRLPLGNGGYLQAAVVNARASTIGDSGGVDVSFRDGVLMIAEVGKTEGRLRGSAGVWRYSRNPEYSVETATDGTPLRMPAQGAYFVIEGDLLSGDGQQLTAFLRAGLSDPHTTPFTGGFQTGLLLAPALVSRPDSQFSAGVHHAWTSDHFRDAFIAGGGRPASGETAFEVTYADTLTPWLSVQPDLQWIRRPGGDLAASDAVVATLRVTASF